MSEEEFVPSKIVINIGQNDVDFDTELSVTEVVFWMRFVEHMIMERMQEPPTEV